MTPRFAAAAVACVAAQGVAVADMNDGQAARHILNLTDVEIRVLIEDVSIVTGHTFIVHPDVRGRVTVTSQTPLTDDEVFQVFLSTLRIQGYAVTPSGKGVYSVVPQQAAVSEAPMAAAGPNDFVTEIIKLEHFNALQAAQMVKPFIDPEGQIVGNASSNTLIVVDYASNLPRLRSVVAELDRDLTMVETLSLSNVPAIEMQRILNDLQSQVRDDTPGKALSVVASETSNTIILRGDASSVARAKAVAVQLDQADPVRDNLRVIPLQNADAEALLPILSAVAASFGSATTGPDGGAAAGAGGRRPATIAHHEPTNSLVISAEYETLLAMERVVGELDVRRKQVLVEAIIVEVSDTTAKELGVQFVLAGRDGTVPFASTNFSRSAPNLLALTGALINDELVSTASAAATGGLAGPAISSLLGIDGSIIGVGGQSGDTLFGAVLTAVQADSESNVLSTPSLMTMDNHTADLLVGQNIPITSGEVLGDANINPFRTVERQDVGVQLTVTPRVGEGDTIRLDISQVVSSVDSVIGVATTPDFILDTRELNTSVVADDGELIVLGGLIEEVETLDQTKVPLLGDIPLFGRLFRSEGKARSRTNLMVFIRPTLVRDAAAARAVTDRNYRYVRAQQLLATGGDEASLDALMREVLGAEPPQ